MIDVFRQTPLMYFFSKLDSIRVSNAAFLDLADEPEQMERLKLYKRIINNEICLSECFDSENEIYLKASFPDDLSKLNGSSNARVKVKLLYWRVSDVEQIFEKQHRSEYLALDGTDDLKNKVNELSKIDNYLSNSVPIDVQARFLKKFLSKYEVN